MPIQLSDFRAARDGPENQRDMLTIRREQMEVLSASMRQSFEERMVRHIAQSFPVQFKNLAPPASGDEPVRALIRHGIEKAGTYDITSERDVGRFIEVMVALGTDFETRPETSWARVILQDGKIPGRVRVELIHQQAMARAGESLRPSDVRTY